MSSTNINRLRSLFSRVPSPTSFGHKLTTPQTPTNTKLTPKAETPVPISSQDKKINSLVNKFKKSTDNPIFRRYHHEHYEATVRRLADGRHFSAIKDILEHQKKYPDIRDEMFAVRLISLYGIAKMLDEAQKLFDEMTSLNCERTLRSFNALLEACVHSKNFDKVRELFKELPEKLPLKPDVVSYNIVVRALCHMGSPDSAVALMDEMERNHVKPNAVTFNTLLDAFNKKNRVEEAERLWGLMEKKNVTPNAGSYNSRLHGLVVDGRILDAVLLIEEMSKKGVKMNIFCYNAVMKGFVGAGNVNEAKVWYKKMAANELRLRPNWATYSMLIPFACDKDDFDYAFELCADAIRKKRTVDIFVVQRVIDGLVARSKNDEAEILMEMANFKQSLVY
ncbi:small ribosomal subunit protein mS86 (rPPR1) [Coffea arabica]|uniref:Small ribosomal subunit protein mS86 (RPPR1) n=1 Tax=Coffea arabica TaxID=13443 RepID=A0A6P6W3N6_COFAR|nr:pentatricopeptide repeat-containing protein At3g13160, mitochondrial-like [Coffea arabica]